MQKIIDPNLYPDDAPAVTITGGGPGTVVSDSTPGDSQREPLRQSTGRCPYHAMLEMLGISPDQEEDAPLTDAHSK